MTGSARSVEGLHVFEVLRTIGRLHRGLFVEFGGNAMAAALAISRDESKELQSVFSVAVRQKLDGREPRPVL